MDSSAKSSIKNDLVRIKNHILERFSGFGVKENASFPIELKAPMLIESISTELVTAKDIGTGQTFDFLPSQLPPVPEALQFIHPGDVVLIDTTQSKGFCYSFDFKNNKICGDIWGSSSKFHVKACGLQEELTISRIIRESESLSEVEFTRKFGSVKHSLLISLNGILSVANREYFKLMNQLVVESATRLSSADVSEFIEFRFTPNDVGLEKLVPLVAVASEKASATSVQETKECSEVEQTAISASHEVLLDSSLIGVADGTDEEQISELEEPSISDRESIDDIGFPQGSESNDDEMYVSMENQTTFEESSSRASSIQTREGTELPMQGVNVTVSQLLGPKHQKWMQDARLNDHEDFFVCSIFDEVKVDPVDAEGIGTLMNNAPLATIRTNLSPQNA